jgi:hypothetical protein
LEQMTASHIPNRSNEMNLMQEDLARAHIQARLAEARLIRRGNQLARAQRLARRADRIALKARLATARAF